MSSSPKAPQGAPPDPNAQPAPTSGAQSLPDPNSAPRGVPFDLSSLDLDDDTQKGFAPKWNRAWIVLAGALVAYCFFFWAYGLGVRAQRPMPLGPVKAKDAGAPATVRVYVEGAVLRPGVYSLNTDARVSDALAMAGGLAPDGDPAALNLAAFVQDGTKISVPRLAATAPALVPPPLAPTTAAIPTFAPNIGSALPPQSTPSLSLGTAPISQTPGTATAVSAASASRTATALTLRSNPIDLNTATSEQLQQLPGVGPIMAERMITYRTINGRFKSVSDLDNIEGIGEKRMEAFKDMVVVR